MTIIEERILGDLRGLSGNYGEQHNEDKSRKVKRLIEEFGWEHIKVNICATKEDFVEGLGEGMWAIVSPSDNEKYIDDNASDIKVECILCNDCMYFPNQIRFGDVVEMELRGDKRAVMTYKEEMPNMRWVHDEEFFKTNVNSHNDILAAVANKDKELFDEIMSRNK